MAGGVTAVLLLAGLLSWISGPVRQLLGLYESSFQLPGLTPTIAALLILFTILPGWMGAVIAVSAGIKNVEPNFEH